MILDQFSLDGKVALVTGASSGIGHELARGLAEAGATIVAAARRTERLEKLVAEIQSNGGKAIAVAMDVTDKQSISDAFDQAKEAAGVIDIVVNNAGVADPKLFLKTDDESLDFLMDTNFGGVWKVAQEGAKRMVEAGVSGSIINIASVLGLGASKGYSAYCSSKGAVVQLTRAMALDLTKYNIRVNAIAPGWFKTEMNEKYFDSPDGQAYAKQLPTGRLGEVSELLGPVLLLASDAGSYVNGSILPVDGAHHAMIV